MADLDGRTLWELVDKRAAASPDVLMLQDEAGRTMTFGEYRGAAERAAAGFAAMGVGEGTNVSWELPTWFESIVLVGALSRLGAIQNPLIPIYRAREVGFMAAQTGARLLIVPGAWRGFDYGAMADEVAAQVDRMDVLVVNRDLPDGDPSTLPPPPATPDDPADLPVRWLFYTSGTTADPKGAQHTDATVKASSAGMNAALAITSEDRSALVFPFTHIGGITWLFTGLITGASQLIVEAFDPKTTIPLMQDFDITLAGAGTPFHLVYLNAQREQPGTPLFPSVRAFPGGAAPKPPQLHYDIKAEMGGVGIVSGYGLTECPILAMNTITDPDDKLAGTEGAHTPGVDIRVVTLEGKPAGPGEEGEIRVTGPQLFRGYLDSSLDADAFDEDGYFRTGDLGNLDAEGFITITGRLKDVIIRKGENISAKEIEDLLYTHPKVADVAVIGLPDPATGERACAVIAVKDATDPITFQEMADFLRDQQLRVQAIPEQLELIDAVPRNPSGKILKHKLREQFSAP
ncbi:MAG: acyl-CoA synthetase (AMP-forming)/AMP-acid ligase [Acidimicrobiales bacterium]|nr:acyl-CoA synthetase (AMP-forming)/AMP-acid ligase [Acidimicrobiales bacterium]